MDGCQGPQEICRNNENKEVFAVGEVLFGIIWGILWDISMYWSWVVTGSDLSLDTTLSLKEFSGG